MATLQPLANECSPERAPYPMHQTTSSATASTAPTERSRVRRIAENARYDADSLHAIIDAAYLCQIAFVDGKGVHCIPTACWREGEHLYIHGSNGGRLIKWLGKGIQASVTITTKTGMRYCAINWLTEIMIAVRLEPPACRLSYIRAKLGITTISRKMEMPRPKAVTKAG